MDFIQLSKLERHHFCTGYDQEFPFTISTSGPFKTLDSVCVINAMRLTLSFSASTRSIGEVTSRKKSILFQCSSVAVAVRARAGRLGMRFNTLTTKTKYWTWNFTCAIKETHPKSKVLDKRTRKSSFQRTLNLRFVWPPTCMDLHRLVMTCLDMHWLVMTCLDMHGLWSSSTRTQFDAGFYQVWTTFCDLRELSSRLANPFAHPSQVHAQVPAGFANLRRLVSPFSQGLKKLPPC